MSRSTMRRTVGVLVMEHIAVGLVEGHKVVGPLSIFPEKPQSLDPLQSMPAEGIVDCIRQQVDKVAGGEKIAAIGIGFPGIIRNGVVEAGGPGASDSGSSGRRKFSKTPGQVTRVAPNSKCCATVP